MSVPTLRQKLEILADAAKYDVSCASSGTAKKNSPGGKGVGSTEGMGICHAPRFAQAEQERLFAADLTAVRARLEGQDARRTAHP